MDKLRTVERQRMSARNKILPEGVCADSSRRQSTLPRDVQRVVACLSVKRGTMA